MRIKSIVLDKTYASKVTTDQNMWLNLLK